MREYNQISFEDRVKLINLRNQGYTQLGIADELCCSQSAISRELSRNRSSTTWIYAPETAQYKTIARRKRGCKIDKNPELKEHITEKLQLGWSPDVISNRVKLESNSSYVSHETIYAWIYQPAQRKAKLYKSLTRHKAKRGPRKSYEPRSLKMQGKTSIHSRPEEINKREHLGHWEGDLVIGKYHKSQALTLLERKSRFLVIEKIPSKKAVDVNAKINEVGKQLAEAKKIPFLSLTLDNGTEFNEFKRLERSLGIDVYFCDPYASWQKGGVENANGIIRRTIPKKSDFNHYNEQDIKGLMWNINTTPRKCLGYKTPYEVIANKELVLSKLSKTKGAQYALAI